ncbi:tRNA (adenosine(37)-N6)-dimethylallyltransferase MiaA [Microaerobacter geothermalis]|uniref:tRNA (adenosine(37)-N6)-dimethylallyltransferase MiaA n=1 Tax=Microaerobacter geothermalis TaxID=674972 RepID=UPI001F00E676|nr:tRNA (adenosine(37)-N6)-dimethylallyltransferase MiaA [Microaerobacter geothermalis]MCF6093127.1 tRNA (adenosine(37)-N6)-dimethylallyltransferase MiaA [Microaerobacter geothermalis]
MTREKLLAIVGPTAVGKTALSLQLARVFDGEIISGDSMQVYRGMDIGTAKVSPAERKRIPHHLIDIKDPDENFSVAEFQALAIPLITDIYSRGKLPILVGGTGLYIKSVTRHYQFPEAAQDTAYRKKLAQRMKDEGPETLLHKLKELDPETANRLHVNDKRRIIRALEIIHLTNKTMTEYIKEQKEQIRESPYDLVMIGLSVDRQKLYQRINLRVDQMIHEGLVKEVKKLLDMGYGLEYTSMQGLGYKELIPYLKGEISLEEAVEEIKSRTRKFAKRQLTWFRQMPEIHWFDVTDEKEWNRNLLKITQFVEGKFPILKNINESS